MVKIWSVILDIFGLGSCCSCERGRKKVNLKSLTKTLQKTPNLNFCKRNSTRGYGIWSRDKGEGIRDKEYGIRVTGQSQLSWVKGQGPRVKGQE